MNAFLGEHCPYVGTYDDPETHYSFVTEENACCVTGEPEFAGPSEQSTLCLRGDFGHCPRFVMPRSSLSQGLASPFARRQPVRGGRRWSTILVGAALGILALSGLFAWGFAIWVFTTRTQEVLPTQVSRQAATTIMLSPLAAPPQTSEPVFRGEETIATASPPIPTASSKTLTPTSSPTPTATPTATPAAGQVTYTVQPGDILHDIALRFEIAADAFPEANEMADPNAIFWDMESDIALAGATPTPILPSEWVTGTPSSGFPFPVPELLEPGEGTFFVGEDSRIILRWESIGQLDLDAWYQVEVWGGGESPRVVVWTKGRGWLLSRELRPGEYHWRVTVVRQEAEVWLQDLSPPSETRSLIWQ